MLLARTAQQDAEENVVLEQAGVVEEARRKEAALRKAAAQPARPGGTPGPTSAKIVDPLTSTCPVPDRGQASVASWRVTRSEEYVYNTCIWVQQRLRLCSSDRGACDGHVLSAER